MDSKPKQIGVDFDATLAFYEKWQGVDDLGEPIPELVDKMKAGMEQGDQFYIFTARVYPGSDWSRALDATKSYLNIAAWCQHYLGILLPILCVKLPIFDEIWDDKGRQVVKNQGVFLDELLDAAHG